MSYKKLFCKLCHRFIDMYSCAFESLYISFNYNKNIRMSSYTFLIMRIAYGTCVLNSRLINYAYFSKILLCDYAAFSKDTPKVPPLVFM